MSAQNDTAPTATVEPIDIDAVMAKLILLRRAHGLPRPVRYDATTTDYCSFQGVYVHVLTGQDVTAWADALCIAEHRRSSFRSHEGSLVYDGSISDWNGWYVRVVSTRGTAAPSELDEDTVAGLEAVAESRPLVSDATIAEVEQVSRMVPATDLHLPQAECGCPVKTSCGNTFVEHCQACPEAVTA